MLDLVLFVSGASLILVTRTSFVVAAYVVLAALTTAFVAPSAAHAPLPLTLFVASTTLKLVVAPVGIMLFLRANPLAGDLRPSIVLPGRLLLVIGFALTARDVAHLSALRPIANADMAAFAILCGAGMLIVHRNLLAHVLGLLVLGTGVTLAGAILAPNLPESVELGATFDALVATFIGLALVRAFVAQDPLLDVESLQRLRG
jgi:hydrogenase-4 component E